MNPKLNDEFHIKIEPVEDGISRPNWTVVIPTYNCAKYLKETLAAVLQQDLGIEQMEIIVVDDCSTKDDPESVVNDLGKGRVQFRKQEKNVGKVKNYETGLKMSRGHLIHILHGDDLVRDGFYIEMERLFMSFSEAKAGFCRSLYIDGKGRWQGLTGMIQEGEGIVPNMAEKLYIQQQIQTPSMVVKREVYETIGTFDRRLNCMEDWEMWTRIATSYPIAVSNKVLAEYRAHGENATNLTFLDGSALDMHRLVFAITDSYVAKEVKNRCSKIRDKKQAEFLMLSYKSRKAKLNTKEKLRFVKSILKLDPSIYKAIRLIK